jgi:hypothetical protein
MRPSLALALTIAVCLLLCGFRLDGLPYIPAAEFSDAAIAHYPAALTIHRTGITTAWTELNMAGQPFAANPLNKTAYPPQWLAAVMPPLLFLNFMMLAHFALAGAGFWGWARRLGLSPAAAGLAAAAYALSPRLIGHTAAGHLDLLYAMAWFPWLMEAAYRVAHAPTRQSSLWMAFTATMLLLADVRLSLFAFSAAGLYIAIEALRHHKRRVLLFALSAGVLIVVATLSVTIPLALWQPYLSRSTLTSAEAGAFSLQPAYLMGLFLAPPAADVEMQTYTGIAVLILTLIALVTRARRLWLWLAMIAVAAAYALGSNGFVWSVAVEIIPPLRWFRVPARAWFIISLLMPLLAGYGFQSLMDGAAHARKKGLAALFIIGIVSILFGGFVLAALPALADSGLRLLIIGGAATLLIALAMQRGKPSLLLLSLIAALTVGDLAWNARQWLEWRSPEAWLIPYAPLAQALRDDNADRVYSPAYSLPQQAAAEYGLSLFGGVDPFQLRGVAHAIEYASGVGNHGYTVVQPPFVFDESGELSQVNRDAVPNTALLAAWQVSHVIAPYPFDLEGLIPLQQIGDIYIYRVREYQQTLPHDQPPRWADAPDLPDAQTVLRNNQLTLAAQMLASASLLCIFIAYAILTLRAHRKTA